MSDRPKLTINPLPQAMYDEIECFGRTLLRPTADESKRLALAAPVMLSALKRVKRDATEWDGDMMDVVDAAIRQAESGE